MAGALENIRKRQARQQEALQAARGARPVNPSPSIAKPDAASTMVRDITRQARAANPPMARKRTASMAKTGGLRAVQPMNAGVSSVSSRIAELEAEMAAKRKAKMKSARMAQEERRRRAADIFK